MGASSGPDFKEAPMECLNSVKELIPRLRDIGRIAALVIDAN